MEEQPCAIYEIRISIYGNYLESAGTGQPDCRASAGSGAGEGLRDRRTHGEFHADVGRCDAFVDFGAFLDRPGRAEQSGLRSRGEVRPGDSQGGSGAVESSSTGCGTGAADRAGSCNRGSGTGSGGAWTAQRSGRVSDAGTEDVAHDFNGAP